MLVLVQLAAIDGTTHEATASARKDGKLLPPGVWDVRKADPIPGVHHGETVVMPVEDMPPHWRDQLDTAGEFGKAIGDPFPGEG